jgi:di/tricarboxylate transporter
MSWEGWLTVGVIASMIALLALNVASTDLLLAAALIVLVSLHSFSPAFPSAADAVAGFGNEALITVGVLFVVVTGLSKSGAMALVSQPVLGRPRTILGAQARLMPPVALLSAFLNNTPIVAMFLPVVSDWSRRTGISPSKLFIPLSYATVLGGLTTLIGTSTSMLVAGLLLADKNERLSMFDLTWVGLPVCLAGLAYLLIVGRRLLPDREGLTGPRTDPREYTFEMLVESSSGLVGRSIEEAGLRHLPGTYLAEIDRKGQVLAAVAPTERLCAGDRLIFVGVVEAVVDLQRIRGLVPATDQVFKLDAPRRERCLVEAVVSSSCPLIGQTIRDGRFRAHYNAVVIAVARNGQRIRAKIGDIVLAAGDTLLIETHASFAEQQRDSRDFYLVSRLEGSSPPRHDRAPIALAILFGMVVAAGFEWTSMLTAAMLAAASMVLTGCCTAAEARRSIDLEVLVSIGAALGVGKALQTSGAAQTIAGSMIELAGTNPWFVLAVVYGVTVVFTEVMSNNAAAALTFPIAMASASSLGVSHMPFVIAIMVAASCGFATPIGYQTHMMVAGPGGYRFGDFLRIGVPLNLVVMIVAVALAPLAWPF